MRPSRRDVLRARIPPNRGGAHLVQTLILYPRIAMRISVDFSQFLRAIHRTRHRCLFEPYYWSHCVQIRQAPQRAPTANSNHAALNVVKPFLGEGPAGLALGLEGGAQEGAMARAGPVAAGRLALLRCDSPVPSRRRHFPVLSPGSVSSSSAGAHFQAWGTRMSVRLGRRAGGLARTTGGGIDDDDDDELLVQASAVLKSQGPKNGSRRRPGKPGGIAEQVSAGAPAARAKFLS